MRTPEVIFAHASGFKRQANAEGAVELGGAPGVPINPVFGVLPVVVRDI